MNADEARDRLIDLLYGELDEPARQAVTEQVRRSPELTAELAELRRARAALARWRAGEPDRPPALAAEQPDEPARPQAPRPSRRLVRWLSPLAAVAAVAIAGLILWHLMGPGTPPARAQGPVEIKRTDVSLTILSTPPDARLMPVPEYQMRQVQARRGLSAQTVDTTNFTNSVWGPRGEWRGLAVVRDRRTIRNLPRGQAEVRFTDVPAGILPDSVRFRSADNPEDLTILEQNYQYDLATVDKLLDRYVDKPVTVAFQDGHTVSGELLSFNGATLVIRPRGEGPRNVSRERVRAVTLAELPQGLLSRPTLLWRLDNRAGLNQRLEVAYMTTGLTWRADYVLKLTPGAKEAPAPADAAAPAAARNPRIFDTAKLVGYATVTNQSGVTYEDAQLKLMAGDVNLVRPVVIEHFRNLARAREGAEQDAAPQFAEKSFFEYHLYTLSRPTTLANAETKQIELVSGRGIRLSRGYVYDPSVHATAARVVSEFKNSRENGLGKPLPKGVVRLYAPDGEGVLNYSGQTEIDHTPTDEKVRLPWGFAFDIACSARQTDRTVRGPEGYAKWRYTIRNHKDYDVTVTVMVRVPRTAYEADCSRVGADKHPWHVRQVGLVEIDVPVTSNTQAAVDFAYRYNNDRGGGLKSPHDPKKDE